MPLTIRDTILECVNANRNISKPHVKFIGENNHLITNETVSKLLIQNYGGVKNVPKETLVLNELEKAQLQENENGFCFSTLPWWNKK